ncbi:PQQ-dependent sugar dehydrogenase [Gilvibacter sp.]|uniref:PQQ-dependent sugar dehydrogenase n=1 Tax=Gilvibacter sp. TaxID=2729997 RepID=UPI003F4A4DCF
MKLSTFFSAVALLFGSLSFAQDIDVELFASGFDSPVDLQNAGDERLFVVEQDGAIRILNPDGTINSTPFLDIDPIVNSGGERGLLGLAFHPDYATNGFFYVYYTNTSNDTQISRFSVSSDPNVADAGSELQMLSFSQPFTNHNGGCLQFGPDGMLYIASGDGGSAGDPGNRSQNLGTLLGKLLRLDVDAAAPYIPADNPYVGDSSALDEIWAPGLRNPWRFSFDADTGELWIADVGQGSREEINKVASTAAPINYGWRCYEGNAPFNTSGCATADNYEFPVAEYTHSSGRCSITGGYVYRGDDYPSLDGLYFFADICTGEIGTVDASNNLEWVLDTSQPWASFGEDINNELYAVSLGGGIYRVVDLLLNVEEQEAANAFNWFVDQATEQLVFKSTNNSLQSLQLFQINGAKVLDLNNLNTQELSVSKSAYAKGLYIAQITDTTGGVQTLKIVL